jgi:hypothetical protein
MPITRLFTSGTHNSLSFTNEDIDALYNKTRDKQGRGKIPFVVGHPKNDLPVVGWLPANSLIIYDEGSKKSIGFSKNDAVFSDESILAIKKLKNDKISIRIKDGEIAHIGLVSNAAVMENNNQDFGGENLQNGCFGLEDFSIGDADMSLLEKIWQGVKSIAKEGKEFEQNDNKMEDKQKNEIEQLKASNELLSRELESLKKERADFEAKQKEFKKQSLKKEVEALNISDDQKLKVIDFANALVEVGKEADFSTFISTLVALPPVPGNGSVVAENADFKAEGRKSPIEEVREQIKNAKK